MKPAVLYAGPASVLKVDLGMATVCAWCDFKSAGEDWAAYFNLKVSHGICQACQPKLFGGASARPSCAVSSATAGRDRHSIHGSGDAGLETVAGESQEPKQAVRVSDTQAKSAVGSNPSAAAMSFLPVAEVAQIVGLAEVEIVRHFSGLCFRAGFDFEQRPEGVILRRAVLPELVGEFAVSGQKGAAARLLQWLTTSGGAVPAEKVYSTPLGPRPVAESREWYQRGAMA